jgi:hypothetical protein
MPVQLSDQFDELQENGFHYQSFKFMINGFPFIMVFFEIMRSHQEYLAERENEIGVIIPQGSYDVKFDRQHNVDKKEYYQPATPDEQLNIRGMAALGLALEMILEMHIERYHSRFFLAVADNPRLKRFYDRLVSKKRHSQRYTIMTNIGYGGNGYAITAHY